MLLKNLIGIHTPYNSPILSVQFSVFLYSVFTGLYNTITTVSFRTFCHPPQIPVAATPPFSYHTCPVLCPEQPRTSSMGLPVLDASYKWNHSAAFLCPISLTQLALVSVRVVARASFSLLHNIPLDGYTMRSSSISNGHCGHESPSCEYRCTCFCLALFLILLGIWEWLFWVTW